MANKITISVHEAGTAAARAFAYEIAVEREVVAKRTITPVETQEIREMAGQYASLLSGGCQAREAEDYLSLLGDGLFHIFFEPNWQEFGSRISSGGLVIIDSPVAEILQLPWEFLRLDKTAAGFDERFSLLRHPKGASAPAASVSEPASGPLRVLFLASEPLNYEQEEKEMLQAAEGLDMDVAICETATPEELKDRVESFQPHVLHLAAQVRLSAGQAHLSLQSNEGKPLLLAGGDLAAALGKSRVRCLVLGGCQTDAVAAQHTLAAALTERMPLTVAWNASTNSAALLYRSLARGLPLSEALGALRRELQDAWLQGGRISPLPILYAAFESTEVVGAGRRELVMGEPLGASSSLEALPGMTEGRAFRFTNRRSDLQRLDPALRRGDARTLIITGPDGSGKSTLATKLARSLERDGFMVLPLYSSRNNPLALARLLESFTGLLARIGRAGEAQSLRNPGLTLAARQRSLIKILNQGKFLILLDGLELDGKTGKILDPELAGLYLAASMDLESSRLIITCRALPADLPPLLRRTWEWQLAGLSEAAFVKGLMQDEEVWQRYRRGTVSYRRLQEVYMLAAGSPACLAAAIHAAGRDLQLKDRDDLARGLLTDLNPSAIESLGRAAVFQVAVNGEGLAQVTGREREEIEPLLAKWAQRTRAMRPDGLWAVSRSRLLAALKPEERLAAQRSAAEFMKSLAEEGKAAEIGLFRLDAMLESRGHYLEAQDLPGARLVTARISGFLERRGYTSLLIRLNKELLAREKHPDPMTWIGRALLDMGDYRGALNWYGQALEMGPSPSIYQGIGMASMALGRHDLARDNFQKAVEICRARGNRAGEAAAWQGLATVDIEQREYDAASEKLQKALEIQVELGDAAGKAETLQNMAVVGLRRGDKDAARSLMLESSEILAQIDDRPRLAEAQLWLGSLDLEKGETGLAEEEFLKALQLKREVGERRGEADVLHSLGTIQSQKGNAKAARQSFCEALRIYQELPDKSGEAGAFFQLGALALQVNRIAEGLRLMALSAIALQSIKSDEAKKVEPVVERLASQLHYSQEQFVAMVQEVLQAYAKDKGWGLVERAFSRG